MVPGPTFPRSWPRGFRQEGYLRSAPASAGPACGGTRSSGLLPGEARSGATERPQLVWLYGAFGAGKSSAAAELKRRRAVAATGVSLARHPAGPVLVPMTLWRPAYVQEILGTLRAAAIDVVHVLLDAPDGVLEARIEADTEHPPEATGLRRARLDD